MMLPFWPLVVAVPSEVGWKHIREVKLIFVFKLCTIYIRVLHYFSTWSIDDRKAQQRIAEQILSYYHLEMVYEFFSLILM